MQEGILLLGLKSLIIDWQIYIFIICWACFEGNLYWNFYFFLLYLTSVRSLSDSSAIPAEILCWRVPHLPQFSLHNVINQTASACTVSQIPRLRLLALFASLVDVHISNSTVFSMGIQDDKCTFTRSPPPGSYEIWYLETYWMGVVLIFGNHWAL